MQQQLLTVSSVHAAVAAALPSATAKSLSDASLLTSALDCRRCRRRDPGFAARPC